MHGIEVSVVVPCLNAMAHLPRALASAREVLPKTGTQIIVADGGSTDGTVEYLRSLDVELLEGPDRSLYEGLNKAISHASGDFIIWLNADDELLPGMRELLQQAKDSGSDLVTGEAETVQGTRVLSRTSHADQEMTAQSVLFAVPTINSRVFRASLLQKAGPFDWEVGLAADRLMMLNLLNVTQDRSALHQPVYRYHSHDGSHTIGNTWPSYVRVHQANLSLALETSDVGPAAPALAAKLAALSTLGCARALLMQGKPQAAFSLAFDLLRRPRLVADYVAAIRTQRGLRGTSSGW